MTDDISKYSDDAKMVLGQLFDLTSTLNFGMIKSRPTVRMQTALDELVKGGALTSEPLNMAGGVSYKLVADFDTKPFKKFARAHEKDPALRIQIAEEIEGA